MMHSITRPETRVVTRRRVSTRRRRRRLVLRAHEARRWDVAANGPLSVENIRALYNPQGYVTAVFDYNDAFTTGTHTHSADFVIVGLGGQYVVDIEGQTFEMKRGDVLNTPPQVPHVETVEGDVETQVAYATKEFLLGLAFRIANLRRAVILLFSRSNGN
eukprot:g3199.t1